MHTSSQQFPAPTLFLCFLLSLLLGLGACSSSKESSDRLSTVLKPYSSRADLEKAVINAGDNLQRLHILLQGTYIRYHYKKKAEGLMKPWLVNDGQDSVLYHIQAVGDPNKHGYLLIHYLCMTHLPNEPLEVYVSKLERITRDSFTMSAHHYRDVTLKMLTAGNLEKTLDLDALDKLDFKDTYRYVKESNGQFRLSTEQSDYAYSKQNPDMVYYYSKGYLNFYVQREDAIFLNEEFKQTRSALNYDVRRYNINLKALSAIGD